MPRNDLGSTRLTTSGLIVAVAAALSVVTVAQRISTIKLATVVPDGSIWDRDVKQMGDCWKEATGGRVQLTVFAGGSQGDEATVLRKLRLGSLQAAAFTSVGLGSIDAAFNVFGLPFFFESYDELDSV